MFKVRDGTERTHWGLKLLAFLLVIVSLSMMLGGGYLIILGGSWYYGLTGLGLLVSAIFMFRGEMHGIWLYLLIFAGTVIWALFEAGFDFWAIEARIVAPLFLASVALLLAGKVSTAKGRPVRTGAYKMAGFFMLVCFTAFIVAMFYPHGVVSNPIALTAGKPSEQTVLSGTKWET